MQHRDTPKSTFNTKKSGQARVQQNLGKQKENFLDAISHVPTTCRLLHQIITSRKTQLHWNNLNASVKADLNNTTLSQTDSLIIRLRKTVGKARQPSRPQCTRDVHVARPQQFMRVCLWRRPQSDPCGQSDRRKAILQFQLALQTHSAQENSKTNSQRFLSECATTKNLGTILGHSRGEQKAEVPTNLTFQTQHLSWS